MDVVPPGKKSEDTFYFRFDEVADYKDMGPVTLQYPMYFGADDDARQEKK